MLADGTADDIDAAHLFVATARAMDLPARVVCGYGLATPADFDRGIADLRRTAGPDGVFCYTFFKALAVHTP